MPRGRRAALLLADLVVLRAVARALEPLRGDALRHAAAEVRALLVQRVDAVLHAVQHGLHVHALLGLGQGIRRVRSDPRAALGHVEEAVCPARSDAWMSSSLPTVIFDAEAAAEPRPQEGEHGRAEAGQRRAPSSATMPRLKNWRRVTPMVSASGGTYGATGAFSASIDRTASRRAERRRRPARPRGRSARRGGRARSDGSPLVALAGLARERARRRRSCRDGGQPRSRRSAAMTTMTGMAMARMVTALIGASSQVEEDARRATGT